MRTFLIALAVLAGTSYAQQGSDAERNPPSAKDGAKPKPAAVMRRLESVNWDPLEARLTWFISVWDLESDMSKPAEVERYVIHVNWGVMENNGEMRPFQVPGQDLHALMDIISTYAMRSTVWWGHKGAADTDKPPELAPDGNDGSKGKSGGGSQGDKPPSPPVGKAEVQGLPAPSPQQGAAAGAAH